MPAKGANYINTGGWQIWRRRAKIKLSGTILGMRTCVFSMQWPTTDSARIKSIYLDTRMRFSSKTAKLKLATE
jgi:hypothetical protein